ncbi:sigma factor [Kitasatospora purpeofusca]|uniref:sigma factor n=1 Tax=Kitasatospora purpeofusca TaxID=67352 RepID=UPI0030F0DC97
MPVRDSPSEREADFSRFAHDVHPAMLRTARLLTGDPHAAQDLAQSALLRIYMSWGRSGTWDNPAAYARRTLVNVHATWRRRHWYREIPHRSPREQGQAQDPAQRWGDLVDLERALAALPAVQRTVLGLRSRGRSGDHAPFTSAFEAFAGERTARAVYRLTCRDGNGRVAGDIARPGLRPG